MVPELTYEEGRRRCRKGGQGATLKSVGNRKSSKKSVRRDMRKYIFITRVVDTSNKLMEDEVSADSTINLKSLWYVYEVERWGFTSAKSPSPHA